MEIEHTPQSEAADADSNYALGPDHCDAAEEARRDRRDIRIAEYEDRCLDHSDPLVASVGSLNAEMLTMAQRIGSVINEALADAAVSVTNFREMSPVLSAFQNLTRQISRNAEFELRAAEAQQEIESLKITLKKMGSSGFSPASLPSLHTAKHDPRRRFAR